MNDKENQDAQADKAAAAAVEAAKHNNDDDKKVDTTNKADTTVEKPTRTEKKLSSGDFVTPSATHTHHPTSKPNALGKIPLVGGLLGGTGGPL
jgi:hypothetical protein